MNREIKFRGIAIEGEDKGKFVYGSYVYDDVREKHIICSFDTEVEGCEPYNSYGTLVPVDIVIRVNKDTVGQYTGLEDKNGNEIYEGDILKEHTPSGFNYSVVKFGEIDISGFSCYPKMCTCFYHDFSNFNDNWGEVALGNNLENIEVIGNIYENPELLETEL